MLGVELPEPVAGVAGSAPLDAAAGVALVARGRAPDDPAPVVPGDFALPAERKVRTSVRVSMSTE